jgi:hypothetical protein
MQSNALALHIRESGQIQLSDVRTGLDPANKP